MSAIRYAVTETQQDKNVVCDKKKLCFFKYLDFTNRMQARETLPLKKIGNFKIIYVLPFIFYSV